MIDVCLLSKPTPTMGAPPTVTPGEPKAPLLLPVVCAPFVVTVPPVVVVPPIPVDDPKPLPLLDPVVSVGDVDELLLKAEPEFPPKGEVDDPAPKEDEEEEPEEPKGEEEDEPDEPKGEEEDEPDEPKAEDDPNELVEAVPVPVPVPVLAPVGVMPAVCCAAWPNKPMAGTLASPRWMMRQSSFPVMGSR